MPFFAQHVRDAQTQLKRKDPVMRSLIRDIGPFTLKTQKNYFQLLIRSIISQQISTAAAATIIGRLTERVGNPILPQGMLGLDVDELRSLGVSQQKAQYCIDLTTKVNDGQVQLSSFGRRSDEEITAELTQVKGIGVWTAQMFLIFGLGRLDVMPANDLGIRNAILKAYSLEELPVEKEIIKLSEPWRPYASIASWYLWRSLDHQKKTSPTK
jgi:DNA-3-methyladenine glycosylase II